MGAQRKCIGMFTPNPYGLFSMPTLETPRLLLRRMTMRDAGDIFAYSRLNSDISSSEKPLKRAHINSF